MFSKYYDAINIRELGSKKQVKIQTNIWTAFENVFIMFFMLTYS
jgi:hypothetical protein